MRIRVALIAVLALALAATGSPAAAKHHHAKKHRHAKKHHRAKKHGAEKPPRESQNTTDTFSGSCSFHGTLYFDPPMTGTPQPLRMRARGKGTCTGTLVTGSRTRNLSNEPAEAESASLGTTSCEASYQSGSGHVNVAGRRIDFNFLEPRGPLGTATWTGKRGGQAAVLARFSQDEDLAQLFANCSGPGVKSLGFDADVVTTPSMTG
jgi:hypothetical protein